MRQEWLGPWRRTSSFGSTLYVQFERLCDGPRSDVVYVARIAFNGERRAWSRVDEVLLDDIMEGTASMPYARTYEEVARSRSRRPLTSTYIHQRRPEKNPKRWRQVRLKVTHP